MISQLQVRNFQSLKKVDLDLGLFTVILGPSNSGKSALIRALQALTSNVRGSSFITQGQTSTVISAVSDEWRITLEKGDSSSYRVVYPDGLEKTYTKLASAVPDDITHLLNMVPSGEAGSLSFASQEDPPFLLKSSGSSVARVLGDLTHVSVVFEAVRESNRRKSAASSETKTRKTDLDILLEKSLPFLDLKSRHADLLSQEQRIADIESLSSDISRLISLVNVLENNYSVVSVTIPPSCDNVLSLFDDFVHYLSLVRVLASSHELFITSSAQGSQAVSRHALLAEEYSAALKEAGTCPVCGSSTC